MKEFIKYFLIGVINTLTHWGIFFLAQHFLSYTQAKSNVLAFIITSSLSYFFNAKFTFKKEKSFYKYCLFIIFMGSMSFLFGLIADEIHINSFATLIAFSFFSLFAGFTFSKFIIFKEKNEKNIANYTRI